MSVATGATTAARWSQERAEIFRVCCMGAIEPEALVGFGVRLRAALHATRVPA